MKVTFELDETNEKMLCQKFESMEQLALSTDARLLEFISAFLRAETRNNPNAPRRKRTREEREQRGAYMGLDWQDILE